MTRTFTTQADVMPIWANELQELNAVADKAPVMFVTLSAVSESPAELRARLKRGDALARRRVAEAFAHRVLAGPDISEAWLLGADESVLLSLVVPDLTLERDLELRAQFAEVAAEHNAELRVYASDRADFARKGERLLR